MFECCKNCIYCIPYPKNNKYNDIDYLCAINGYYIISINKDIHKIKRFSPGGKELKCQYKRDQRK